MTMEMGKAVWYYNTGENSDKIHITIFDKKSMLTTYWGRRGGSLQTKGKIESAAEFYKVVSSKTCKGYRDITDKEMIKDLARQLESSHGKILLASYGLGAGISGATGSTVSAGASGTAGSTGVTGVVPRPAKTKTLSTPTPIPFRLLKGEKALVECISSAHSDEFEEGIEYYCVEADGLVMRVMNMEGNAVYVLPSDFKFKGKV